MNEQTISLEPIGKVIVGRSEVKDDYWGEVESVIELDSSRYTDEVLFGLEDFSHIEVIYHMNQVDPIKIETKARHPRNNKEWPLVGIFAQRPKARPNRLGLSRCNIVKIEGLQITVQALDAITGTPILDIKPYMSEFGPIGDVRQPAWSKELMKNYYR